MNIRIHENAAEGHADRNLGRKPCIVSKVRDMNIITNGLSIIVAVIEKVQVLNRAWPSQEDKKEREATPVGIIHSSLLYDNDSAGKTRGSRAVRAVVIQSDSFTTTTFSPPKFKIR